jgi:hypothetical protein
MKVNVEIECTPAEARALMGLPDLTPLHDRYVAMVAETMGSGVSPEMVETMVRSWMPMGEAGLGLWRRLVEGTAKT